MVAQASANLLSLVLSGGLYFQRQVVLQAAPSLGQPRPNSPLGRATSLAGYVYAYIYMHICIYAYAYAWQCFPRAFHMGAAPVALLVRREELAGVLVHR